MSDQDPSVQQWRDATQKSAGAQLREALEANRQLALDHAKCVLEVERLRADLARARQEIERLNYHLTEKGPAAIAEPNPTEQEHP